MRRKPPRPPCPKCGRLMTVIYYGMPTGPEVFEAERRRELVIGGCAVWPDMPAWRCLGCGAEAGQWTRALENLI